LRNTGMPSGVQTDQVLIKRVISAYGWKGAKP
jgi:hypothetical protein